MVPLVAAFTVLFAAFVIGLSGRRVPVLLQRIYGFFWGLLFIGFVAAEIAYFNTGDRTLTLILNPVFNFGVLAGMLYALCVSFLGIPHIESAKEKLLVRGVILYYLFCLFLFFTWNTSHVPLNIRVSVLVRSLLGLAYNLPPLIVLGLIFKNVFQRPAMEPGKSESLERWLKDQNVSPRESEVIQLILSGKSNHSIEKELFISRRTVESHIYNIYRKLGVKNRVQLMRMVSEKSKDHFQ